MVEIAAGVELVWARSDGVGVVVSAAAVLSALSVLAALVPVDVGVLSSTVSAAAFVSVPLSGLSVSLFVSADCTCCSAVA